MQSVWIPSKSSNDKFHTYLIHVFIPSFAHTLRPIFIFTCFKPKTNTSRLRSFWLFEMLQLLVADSSPALSVKTNGEVLVSFWTSEGRTATSKTGRIWTLHFFIGNLFAQPPAWDFEQKFSNFLSTAQPQIGRLLTLRRATSETSTVGIGGDLRIG